MRYPNFLRLFICLFVLSFASFTSRASHLVGADMRYEWLSGNTYKIIVSLYGDCGPASAAALATLPTGTPKVCVYNGGTSVTMLTLALDTPGYEVTPFAALCGITASQCTSPSLAVPGIKLFRYSVTYTLPDTSSVWRFIFNGNYGSSSAGRAAAITNLSGGSTIQLIDTLNNAAGPNSSPVLNVVPLPYYGTYVANMYNPVAIDTAGDSLVYTLAPATNGTGACATVGGAMTYTSGLSYAAPLSTAGGSFTFNSSTGEMTFFTTTLQRGVVVYNIREYRSGVLVGSSQREITVLTMTGTSNYLPTGKYDSSTTGTIVDSVNYTVCATAGAFTASIHARDSNATDSITVTPVGLPTGATFNTIDNGTPHPVSTFSWNTTGVTPGSYTFYVIYNDDHCPSVGVDTVSYHVTITPAPCTPSSGSVSAIAITGLSMYPNPTKGICHLELPVDVKNAGITVGDIYGRVVMERTADAVGGKMQVDLSSLPGGTYMIKVSAKDKVYRTKVMITP